MVYTTEYLRGVNCQHQKDNLSIFNLKMLSTIFLLSRLPWDYLSYHLQILISASFHFLFWHMLLIIESISMWPFSHANHWADPCIIATVTIYKRKFSNNNKIILNTYRQAKFILCLQAFIKYIWNIIRGCLHGISVLHHVFIALFLLFSRRVAGQNVCDKNKISSLLSF